MHRFAQFFMTNGYDIRPFEEIATAIHGDTFLVLKLGCMMHFWKSQSSSSVMPAVG